MPNSSELLQKIIQDVHTLNNLSPHKLESLIAVISGIREGTIKEPDK